MNSSKRLSNQKENEKSYNNSNDIYYMRGSSSKKITEDCIIVDSSVKVDVCSHILGRRRSTN
ncbi:MAG TPA: hypothetical protein VKA95_11765 [Nitrososphaeraceae archaeon]|nr:hypothetical protein [Nitrososphaeraceae archaeon]